MKTLVYAFALSGLCVIAGGISQRVLAGEGSTDPVNNSPKPDTALVSCHNARVYDLNFKEHQFTADLILSIITSKTTDYKFDSELQVWDSKEFHIKTISQVESGNKLITLLRVRAIVFMEFNVQSFPFDGQHVAIKLYNAAYGYDKLVFHRNEIIAAPGKGLLEDGWVIHNIYDTAYRENLSIYRDSPQFFSTLNLVIDLHRENAFQLFAKVFIGMFVAALIAFASLYIDVHETEAVVALGVGGILGAVGNKYIIEGMLPQSCQFCLPDWLHTITIVFILAVIITSVVAMRKKTGKIRIGAPPKRKLPMVILGAYLLANFMCIYWAVMHEARIDAHAG